jgi:L-threonylcarbamoyladenylate synthase
VHFTGAATKLAERFLPGPLTIILNTKLAVSELLGGERIGVRIPANEVARALLERVKFPITSTSANISGRESAATAQEVVEQLGERVDVILDAGPCTLSKPSTIVDFSDGKFEIVREGAIPKEEIEKFIES